MIKYLVQYFNNIETTPVWIAYCYAAGISLGALLIALLHHIYFFHVQRIGWHMRASTCALMYKKVKYLIYLFVFHKILSFTSNHSADSTLFNARTRVHLTGRVISLQNIAVINSRIRIGGDCIMSCNVICIIYICGCLFYTRSRTLYHSCTCISLA